MIKAETTGSDNRIFWKGANERLIEVPLCHQETLYTCGVACVQSILGCYGIDSRQNELARHLQAKPVYGTDFRRILSYMRSLGFKAEFEQDLDLARLRDFINQGVTPMLIIQAWGIRGTDYEKDWRDGHFVLACGYSGDRIIFMDPLTIGNYTYLSGDELLQRWHAIEATGLRYYNSALIIKDAHRQFVYQANKNVHLT